MNRLNKALLGNVLVACFTLSVSGIGAADNGVRIPHLQTYMQQGIQPNAVVGEQLWHSKHGDRSCSSCHGNDLSTSGKHVKTGKTIDPMALSANPSRYQDRKKIEKWFLRNCKWTWGRTCSQQEKADILAWLQNQ
jgi:hypothetical protein